ncbi:MAG: hypothetical protein ACI914_000042 [Candidatus Marivariicella framensis]|jgi:hypothetical protein|tara:strand:- start:664 stop:1041 length:378 start_codon:yes stop_codon:yes gene_type:complete
MKSLLLTVLLSMTYFFSWSQESFFKVEQDSLISKLISLKTKINKDIYATQFYNIQLFNGEYEKSLEIKKSILLKFPEEMTNLSFETPNYKVQMGPFRDYRKAIDLLKLIKKVYPAAFLIEPKKPL